MFIRKVYSTYITGQTKIKEGVKEGRGEKEEEVEKEEKKEMQEKDNLFLNPILPKDNNKYLIIWCNITPYEFYSSYFPVCAWCMCMQVYAPLSFRIQGRP